jgi:hypothetical protein
MEAGVKSPAPAPPSPVQITLPAPPSSSHARPASAPAASPAITAEPLPLAARAAGPAARHDALSIAFAVLFGVVMSLCVEGYQFGKSNHTVYLLDALRKTQPELLANDWFTTQTLQYHFVFGWITSTLFKLGLVEPGFLLSYLFVVTMFHLGWYLLTIRVGGGQMTYLFSLLLYYLSAGGLGLGMYQFMQDGAFLPSNVANVALLWAIVLWVNGAFRASGLAIGLAGLFHLNHAVVGVALWTVMMVWEMSRPVHRDGRRPASVWIIGTALALLPSAVNIAMALQAKLTRSSAMPLSQFIDLYVRLRHPHHYDPSSWPIALWICFLWPIAFAVFAARLRPPPVGAKQRGNGNIVHPAPEDTRFARVAAARFFILFAALLGIALLGAGIFYVSESLVQMSLYRFSIFPKLMSCIGVAYLVCDSGRVPRVIRRSIAVGVPLLLVLALTLVRIFGGRTAQELMWRQPGPIGLFVALCCGLALYELSRERTHATARGRRILHPISIAALLAVLGVGWGRWMGFDFGYTPQPHPDHAKLTAFVRDPANTPLDATFLVSPSDEMFRLHAKRAIVVNFKAVPQLSGELAVWHKRLCDVLDLPTLTELPRPFNATTQEMERRYNALPEAHLEEVAELYGARYIVTRRRLSPDWDARAVFGSGEFVLYDREK